MSNLISEEYRVQNIDLHKTGTYGISGQNYRNNVRPIAEWGRLPILDYGCGRSTLKESLGPAYTVHEYDPAIPGKMEAPEPCDIVTCTDVLEHIEPELLANVLDDLRRVTKQKAFIAIALAPSSRTLPDGRNAHLSLHSVEEWRNMLEAAGFKIIEEKPSYRTVNLWWAVCE